MLRAAALLAFLLRPGPSPGANFSLNPSADAFVTPGPTGNLGTNNYGGAGALSVAAPGSAKGEFQSVMQFDLSGAESAFNTQFGTGQWTVQSVTLQLTAGPPANNIFNTTVAGRFAVSLMQSNGWIEGTGTPMNPATNGITFATLSNFVSSADEPLGAFSFDGSTNATANYSLNLAPSLVSDILVGGTTSFRLFAGDAAVSYLFDSRTFNTAADRPLLTITAVPEPGSFAVGLAALAVVAARGSVRRL